MAEANGELTVAERLGRLLDQGLLPAGGPAEAAERLLERLERPARVALLGLPGCGKSAILNLLAGTTVVPETLRLPTIIVQYGRVARMLCTLADGRIETIPGTDLTQAMSLNPALVTIEMDLPSLKVISLLEVSAGPMEAEQRRAALWASKRADIVIWCSTSYLPKEQVVWESLPDTVKDNGFLFLTKVDLLGGREVVSGMVDRVEQRASEDFRQVLSISAAQARAAMAPGKPIDRDKFRDSGAAAVITTIKTRVQMARRADMDMAELLLARHIEATNLVAQRFAAPPPSHLDDFRPMPVPEWTAPPEWAPPPEAGMQAQTSAAQLAVEQVSAPQPDVAVSLPAAVDHPVEVKTIPEEPSASPASDDAALSRLSDRLRTTADGHPAASPVPVRSTWKSPAEVAAELDAAQGTDEKGAKLVQTNPALPDIDQAVAKAAQPGARLTPAARPLAEPAPDLAGLRVAGSESGQSQRPSPFSARVPEPSPQPAARFPRPEGTTPQPRPRIAGSYSAAAPRTSHVAAPPVAPPSAPPATERPVVAVLHDRRPEPEPPSRRERPRITARVLSVQAAPVGPQPVSASDKAALDDALRLLSDHAEHLLPQIDPKTKPPVDLILEQALETIAQVSSTLSGGNVQQLRRINSTIGEAQDLITLMQLEKGHAPADDAVTILLQIKREIETLLAS